MFEFLLFNVHGGEKAHWGRGRVGKGGQKSETSKQALTRKTKAAVDRRQNSSVRPALRSDHTAPRSCCPNCYAEQSHKDSGCVHVHVSFKCQSILD